MCTTQHCFCCCWWFRVKALSHVQGGKIASSAKKEMGLQPCIIEAHFLGFLVHLTDQSKSQASTMHCRGFMEAYFLGFLVHPTDQSKSWASTMHNRGFMEAHSLGFLVHPTDQSKSWASTMRSRGFTEAHFLGFLVHPTNRSKPWASTMHRVHGSSFFRVSWTPPPTNPSLGLQPCIIEGSWKLIV
jgi:hypothetical protein